ncbi:MULTISPECIES: hypothetical protein [Clostridia]|uniref:hypothetical protein n=1 Tax=Clostridia TaxID=186801 RepID=UPI000EA35135|nr:MULTISPECIES: hypothetical protein [Clostridia]NBJ70700.1 hypothetical protein [Roseburia sp. 1XD42-34]RKI76815.1 hypothetical protein D7V87_12300 [Clostridium sp. 1xD42-85]
MIVKEELLKLIKMPIISIVILFFIALNIVIVMSNSYLKEELSVLSELVDTYGYEINENMMKSFGKDYQDKVSWINEIAPNEKEIYQHPSELLLDDSFQYENRLNHKDYQKLLKYSVIENYYVSAQEIDKKYDSIDLGGSAEYLISTYGFTGHAAEVIREQYQKLGLRLDELIDNGEHKNLFFIGKLYKMHSFLFRHIGMALIFELMILVVLITAAITNYEFEHRTTLVTYTTKRGRKLIIDKFLAAMITNGCIMFGLIGITLGFFFLTYDYSRFWNVPISNFFNTEMPLPYISWWNLSFIEYFIFFVLFIIMSQLLFMGISFILSIYIKNTYLVFFTFIILLGLGITIPGFVPLSSSLVFLLQCNPFAFILNPHEWLMGNGPFTIYRYYELATTVVWTFFLGAVGSYTVYRFYRQQL